MPASAARRTDDGFVKKGRYYAPDEEIRYLAILRHRAQRGVAEGASFIETEFFDVDIPRVPRASSPSHTLPHTLPPLPVELGPCSNASETAPGFETELEKETAPPGPTASDEAATPVPGDKDGKTRGVGLDVGAASDAIRDDDATFDVASPPPTSSKLYSHSGSLSKPPRLRVTGGQGPAFERVILKSKASPHDCALDRLIVLQSGLLAETTLPDPLPAPAVVVAIPPSRPTLVRQLTDLAPHPPPDVSHSIGELTDYSARLSPRQDVVLLILPELLAPFMLGFGLGFLGSVHIGGKGQERVDEAIGCLTVWEVIVWVDGA
jgi:hypothetical protein